MGRRNLHCHPAGERLPAQPDPGQQHPGWWFWTGANRPPDQAIGLVGFDWLAGAYTATRHLIDRGHRRIGFVGGIGGRSSSMLRERGFQQALQESNLPIDPSLIREGDFFTESGYRQTRDLLIAPRPPFGDFSGQ